MSPDGQTCHRWIRATSHEWRWECAGCGTRVHSVNMPDVLNGFVSITMLGEITHVLDPVRNPHFWVPSDCLEQSVKRMLEM